MKVVVTIGVLNEEENICKVLERIPQGYDVLLVDDGSSDSTVTVAKQYGAKIISHLTNLGQGFAVITSFKAALLNDYDIIVEMDGDGQHDPLEIPKFIKKMEKFFKARPQCTKVNLILCLFQNEKSFGELINLKKVK